MYKNRASNPESPAPNQKVVVAMSGGVDSSVAAALLKEQGYEVIGATMQIWQSDKMAEEAERFGGCCSISAVEDARRVAAKLDIPYYVLNFRDVFKEKVIDNFLSEYKHGRTPNPCIRCNQFIKFEAFLDKAKGLGAHFIATGHYAQITYDEITNRYQLYKGVDEQKDQSYALYMITQEQLKSTLFPLGGFTKKQVREMAQKIGFEVADKPESQEICFIPDNNYRWYLLKEGELTEKEGPIFDYAGRQVGTHNGIHNYTIGQRKGLGVISETPLYVLDINSKSNSIKVGIRENLACNGLIACDPNFIPFTDLTATLEIDAQIRYNSKPARASISSKKDKIKVTFEEPQKAITPGQAVVFYQGSKILGGATIEKAI